MTVRVVGEPRITVKCGNCFRKLSFELSDRGQYVLYDAPTVNRWFIRCAGCSWSIDLGVVSTSSQCS